jgi:hypothetical protein
MRISYRNRARLFTLIQALPSWARRLLFKSSHWVYAQYIDEGFDRWAYGDE